MTMQKFFSIILTVAALAVAGCVSEPVQQEKAHMPALMNVSDGDGNTTLSFKSEPGYVYTILFMDKQNPSWTKLPQGLRLRGTGKTIYVKDKVNPRMPTRRYWLEVVSGPGIER